jgi:Transposase DDE domain
VELQLIKLYSWVCLIYDSHPNLKYQRLSNNWQPTFTDQELITIYLFGQLQGHFKQNRIHQYISQHFRDWFPDLPVYQTFNYRLNNLAESLQVIVYALFEAIETNNKYHYEADCLLDSMPIMLAVRGRSYQAKVATDEANQSYCSTKEIWYHGVKLHLLARKQRGRLPKPEIMKITPAAEHDLRVLQELEGCVFGNVFADKAYKDRETELKFKEQGVIICTPDKKKKNQEVYEVGQSGLWSRFVSTIRQPIESLFNWINEKTEIQNGSKIRSANGLFVHCYGKLAVALFALCFNY